MSYHLRMKKIKLLEKLPWAMKKILKMINRSKIQRLSLSCAIIYGEQDYFLPWKKMKSYR